MTENSVSAVYNTTQSNCLDLSDLPNKQCHQIKINVKQEQEEQKTNKNANFQKHKNSLKLYTQCMIICFGSLFQGYNVGVLNLAQPRLNIVYDIVENKALYQGFLSSIVFFGSTIGCFIAGIQATKFGVRISSIQCDIVAIFLSCFLGIPNYYVCLIVRFLLGIIGGINCAVCPVYIKQISPVSLLGKTGSFFAFFLGGGVFIAYLIGLEFPLDEGELQNHGDFYWRFAVMFSIIICSVRLVCLLFVYDINTPIFCLQQNQEENSKQSLERVYKQEFVEEQLGIVKEMHQRQIENKDSWKGLFKKQNRQQLVLGCMISFIFQFSGIMTLLFYSRTIFENTTGDKQTAIYMSVITAFLQITTSLFSGELAKHYGRRTLQIVGNISISIILISVGTISLINKDSDEIPLFSAIMSIGLIFLFCIVFRLTTGTVGFIYVAEILSVKGNAVATACQHVSAFSLASVFPLVIQNFGIYTAFYFFGFVQFLGVIYVYFKAIETKGLSQIQIFEKFQQNNKVQSDCVSN